MIRGNPDAIAIGAILIMGMGGWVLDSLANHISHGMAPFRQEFRMERDNFRTERDRFRIEQQEKFRIERERFRNEGEKIREELHRAFRFRRV